MKYLHFIVFLFSFGMNGQDFSKNIEKTTLEYRKLFLDKNFEALSDFASPKLI